MPTRILPAPDATTRTNRSLHAGQRRELFLAVAEVVVSPETGLR